jgi:hypothetical protein|nr:MAG TPA: terminase small subunit [Caudoviricetes sp.]
MPNYKITQTKLNRMAKEMLETAEAYGLTDDYLFMTTFRRYTTQVALAIAPMNCRTKGKRYTTQVALAEELQKSLEQDGVLVTKEYVKGRANIYTHPGINSYNRVTDSANKTAQALSKMLEDARVKKEADPKNKAMQDPLLNALKC